jgi:hypothetical protein
VPLAFFSRPAAIALYIAVIALWLIPDRRLAGALADEVQVAAG